MSIDHRTEQETDHRTFAEPDETRSNYQRPAGGPQGWMETL